MPDHIHLIFTPLYDGDSLHSVAETMQGIKGASAHKINHLLERTGQVWQRESFDRVLRREESTHAKVEYMLQNPVRAGLVQNATEYSWVGVGSGSECVRHKVALRACLAAARARALAPTLRQQR
jgi:putative transposase